MGWVAFILLLLLMVAQDITAYDVDDKELLKIVSHYEIITFDPAIQQKVTAGRTFTIDIKGYGQVFRLALTKTDMSGVFAPGAKIILLNEDGSETVTSAYQFTRNRVEGNIIGRPNSSVFGRFEDGVFLGHMEIGREVYYVENADKYFGQDVDFDSVMYRARDIRDSRLLKDSGTSGQEDGNYHFTSEDDSMKEASVNEDTLSARKARQHIGHEVGRHDISVHRGHHFQKGKAPPQSGTNCKVKVVADFDFYKEKHKRSEQALVDDIVQQFKLTNEKFRPVDFLNNSKPSNLGFTIESITIICDPSDYNVSLTKNNTQLYLSKFCEKYNFNNVCAGVLFSGAVNRDPETAGASWADGSVCSRELSDSKTSSNCAFVTNRYQIVNAQTEIMTPERAANVLGHEFGHMLGGQIDGIAAMKTDKCRSGPESNWNIMAHDMARSGNPSANNWQFSSCSIKDIGEYLKKNGNCFS